MKTVLLILFSILFITCNKTTDKINPIKYNTLIVGSWREYQFFDNNFVDNLSVNLTNDLEEGLYFRIDDPVPSETYVINDLSFPMSYCIIIIWMKDLLVCYDQHEIYLTVEVFNDSIYQGIITGTVINDKDVLKIECIFKLIM